MTSSAERRVVSGQGPSPMRSNQVAAPRSSGKGGRWVVRRAPTR